MRRWEHCPRGKRARVFDILEREVQRLPLELHGIGEAALRLLHEQMSPRPKGYPKEYALQILIVEGGGRFPLEMADRDRCAPASEMDALRMGERREDERRRVVLHRFVQSGRSVPHVRRWLSYGWGVVWYGSVADYQMRRLDPAWKET